MQGNQRFPSVEQIGQPPIHFSNRLMGNLQRPAPPYESGQSSPATASPGMQSLQGPSNRCAFLPGGVLRVSQVGLPNPPISSPNLAGQCPPSSSPYTVHSSSATPPVFSISPIPPQSPSSSSLHSVETFSNEPKRTEVKLESTESPECLLGIKQVS